MQLSLKSLKTIVFILFIGLLFTILQWQERETIDIKLEILEPPTIEMTEIVVVGFERNTNFIHSN